MAREVLDAATLERINAVCPGTRIEGARPGDQSAEAIHDVVWGSAEHLAIGYAGDPAVRHRGSTAGVLTALGQFLLASGRVKFILHVSASSREPLRTDRRLSFDTASVQEGAGSRYGPAATLVDFTALLDRGETFALIAKPCDVAAVRNLARIDPRVDRYLAYALTFVCGGASDLTKSEEVLSEFGIRPEEISLFRYRGYGNPGPTRLETRDGRSYELTYQDMWKDEATWRIQPRCKICPDAIGESSDLAASDVWPGGAPAGENPGFNGIIVRTRRGLELTVQRSRRRHHIERTTFRDFDGFQRIRSTKRAAPGGHARLPAVPRAPTCAGRVRASTWAENLAEPAVRHRAPTAERAKPPAVKRS